MIFVDTCILVDVLGDDEAWADWSATQLEVWAERGPLVVNPIVYAELAAGFPTPDALEEVVLQARLDYRELPKAALFLAGKAHQSYRRRGGTRAGVLADFLIGAHAVVLAVPVLTRDPRRFSTYFPTLRLVSPAR